MPRTLRNGALATLRATSDPSIGLQQAALSDDVGQRQRAIAERNKPLEISGARRAALRKEIREASDPDRRKRLEQEHDRLAATMVRKPQIDAENAADEKAIARLQSEIEALEAERRLPERMRWARLD